MRITDILNIRSIEIGLDVSEKKELLDFMLILADKSGKVIDINDAKKEVFEREKIMSTGVGKETALPHAKTNSISDTVGALALLKSPIDYETLDDRPVSVIFLLLGMENNVGIHLRLLSKISRLLTNDSFRSDLLACKANQEVIDLFNSFDEND